MEEQGLESLLVMEGVCDGDRDGDGMEGGERDEAMLWEGVKV